MTLGEALADVQAKRAALDAVVSAALDETGLEAVRRVKAEWPRDTGDSAEAWDWDTSAKAVANPLPYVPYVHNGLADELVPRTFRELEPFFSETFTRRLDAVRSA